MKAKDFWIQREVERNPGYDDMVKDQVSDMSGIFKLMEEYHQSQLQALKEEVNKLPTRKHIGSDEVILKKWVECEKILNLITNLEDK